MSNISSIEKFFYPKSIVLIGASSKPLSIGYELLRMILNYGFKGKIFIINPNTEKILDIKCNKNLDELEETPDLAIILVPKRFVFDSIKECAKNNVKNIVIITAGFKETGEEGAKAEREIVEFARQHNLRLVGPNCMGLINSEDEVKLNATFAAELPKHAKVGFISQSGALGAAILNTINETGYSFNQFISVGNKCDVNENDLLEYWNENPNIKVITAYLESFVDGKKFFELAKNVSIKKPIVLLKSARSEAGKKAAISHTGALASSDIIVNTMINQSGIIRANTLEELFETAKAFDRYDNVKTKNVAVLSNAGGFAILCSDEIEKQGLNLAQLKNETIQKVKAIILEEASPYNPIDMLPAPSVETYCKVLEYVLEDENVDSVIAILVEPIMFKPFDHIKKLAEYQLNSKKPILLAIFPLPDFWERWKSEGIENTLIYKNVETPVQVLGNMNKRYQYLSAQNVIHKEKESFFINEKIKKSVQLQLKNSKNELLSPIEIYNIFTKLKLPLIKSTTIRSYSEAKDKLNDFNFPVVLKILSDEFTHKSDIGGVVLDIKNLKQLKESISDLEKRLKAKNILSKISGYEIQEYITGGIELIIGGFTDPNFGKVIMFGLGGKFVEIIKDTNFLLTPFEKSSVIKLIENSRAYPLLTGYRGEKKYDIDKLAELITKIGSFFHTFDEIIEFDINPFILKTKFKDSKIVDCRIKVNK